jgi:hypothetical protein
VPVMLPGKNPIGGDDGAGFVPLRVNDLGLEPERHPSGGNLGREKAKSANEVNAGGDRVDDAMHATRAAVEEGVLPGGGVALLRAAEALKRVRTQNRDQKTGVDIVRKALSWPARQIAINARPLV